MSKTPFTLPKFETANICQLESVVFFETYWVDHHLSTKPMILSKKSYTYHSWLQKDRRKYLADMHWYPEFSSSWEDLPSYTFQVFEEMKNEGSIDNLERSVLNWTDMLYFLFNRAFLSVIFRASLERAYWFLCVFTF